MSDFNVSVAINSEDSGILSDDVAGLSTPIQAVRVQVTCDSEVQFHLVVRAAAHPFVPPNIDTIAEMFPDAFVSVIEHETNGHIALLFRHGEANAVSGAAAAAATLHRSWGWDESPTIRVELRGANAVFILNPIFIDGAWQVTGSAGG